MFVCLIDELILGFCRRDLTLQTGGFERTSTINLVLQANRLNRCGRVTAASFVSTAATLTVLATGFISFISERV